MSRNAGRIAKILESERLSSFYGWRGGVSCGEEAACGIGVGHVVPCNDRGTAPPLRRLNVLAAGGGARSQVCRPDNEQLGSRMRCADCNPIEIEYLLTMCVKRAEK